MDVPAETLLEADSGALGDEKWVSGAAWRTACGGIYSYLMVVYVVYSGLWTPKKIVVYVVYSGLWTPKKIVVYSGL